MKNSPQYIEPTTPSIKCRLAHLAEDPASADILGKIYATDSSIRTLDYWKTLAIDYVNNIAWQPKRSFLDERVIDIDPSRCPDDKFTPESLRSVFSRLRIDYTRTILKFQASLKQGTQREVLDTEFWERYAKHDKSLYYIYQLFFDKIATNDYLMIDAALSRTDVDLDLTNSALNYPPFPLGRKRDRHDLGDDDDAAVAMDLMEVDGSNKRMREDFYLGSSNPDEIAWQAAVRKDRAIGHYYRRMTINNDIKFHMDLLTKENVGEAMKRNIKAKMNMLLLKKVEDRYDDL